MSQITNRTEALPVQSPRPPLNSRDMPAPLDANGKISWEAFLDWLDEDTHAEWIDGEIELMSSPASYRHQDIGGFLVSTLRTYIRMTDCGIGIPGEFMMRLLSISRGRAPDFVFLRTENAGRLQDTHLQGPADVAVEIVSPESVTRDTQTKLSEYQSGGVAEYWLINPMRQTAQFYVLQENGQYREAKLDQERRFHSTQIAGFWLKPEWFWQQPMPTTEAVLAEIAGAAYVSYLIQQLGQRGIQLPPHP